MPRMCGHNTPTYKNNAIVKVGKNNNYNSFFSEQRMRKVNACKAEHLYSSLHGIQTTLKRSGMDHTAFNLQRTPCQPLPRKRSPDGASTECGGGHLIATHY